MRVTTLYDWFCNKDFLLKLVGVVLRNDLLPPLLALFGSTLPAMALSPSPFPSSTLSRTSSHSPLASCFSEWWTAWTGIGAYIWERERFADDLVRAFDLLDTIGVHLKHLGLRDSYYTYAHI